MAHILNPFLCLNGTGSTTGSSYQHQFSPKKKKKERKKKLSNIEIK
jgi:hypothetical protein